MYGMNRMRYRIVISVLSLLLAAVPAMGQVLMDGISGRDRFKRLQFIQAISTHGDTCLVMSDTLGRFEIDPELMDGMRGNVYLKPMVGKPRGKLTLDSPFDSIEVYRQGRGRYLTQGHIVAPENEDPVFYYDSKTTLLKESVVTANRYAIARDKVTSYLDSLYILSCPEWASENGYLNDYHGYDAYPEGSYMEEWYNKVFGGKRLVPKRGELYELIRYDPLPNDPHGAWYISAMATIIYPGPYYTEDDLVKINGMWRTKGYLPKREFYQPDKLDLASPTPDYRILLQWQPAVLTDENGVAEVPFAASDVNTEFIGIIESVDGMGLQGCQTFSFRVFKQ